jgi:hypothetical protein
LVSAPLTANCLLERPEIRLATPCGGIAWIDMDRDQPAVRLNPQDELAPIGVPRLAECRRYQPGAIVIAAFGRPTIGDSAAVARRAVGAPGCRRFRKRIDLDQLAAQRAVAATAPRHERQRVGDATIRVAIRHRPCASQSGATLPNPAVVACHRSFREALAWTRGRHAEQKATPRTLRLLGFGLAASLRPAGSANTGFDADHRLRNGRLRLCDTG